MVVSQHSRNSGDEEIRIFWDAYLLHLIGAARLTAAVRRTCGRVAGNDGGLDGQ